MRFKKVLALVMTASLLVSSSFLNAPRVSAAVVENTEALGKNEAAGSDRLTLDGAEKVEDKVVTPDKMTPLETNGVERNDDLASFEATESIGTSENTEPSGTVSLKEIDRESVTADLYQNSKDNSLTGLLNEETISDEDMVRVIIVMDGDSIIEKDSNATMNFFTRVESNFLEFKQNTVLNKIEDKVFDGEELEVRYHYTWLLNGIATEIPYGMIDEIEAVKGVEDVIIQPVYEVADASDSPYTVADGEMIGRDATWADGYTGKGIKIAVIDTGIDDDHQNFGALSEECLTEDSATKETISKVLGDLNASALYSGLTVNNVYRSSKIAYGFNYVDENLRINHSGDTQGDHGTHVAGIAAANDLDNGEAVGVAPDAQLYIMKVFGANGGAYTDDLLAAVEDSLILGADVINMSLGSPAGFTSEGEILDEIYGRVSETNTILAIAAGNSSTAGQGNMWGTDTNLTSNPDNSIISSPATYVSATSVASVDNVGTKGYYLEANGKKISYIEGLNGTNNPLVETLGGQSFAYAMVDNFGQTAEDFEAADVEGKVAVVQRGVTAFSEKIKLAEDAGAIACLIYNNTSGEITMDLSQGSESTIPCASITMKSGEFLKSSLEENPEGEIAFSEEQDIVPSETGYRMSDFSSWGASPNLCLEPDVTAPGGNIYSTRDDGTYGLMSGTSMASPNMAGVSALVMQYAKENFKELSASELHFLVNGLIVSTAEPLSYDEENWFSPRNQGAGLVNAYNAVKTEAYLSVDGVDVPKAEVKDDPDKTGNYSYNFLVHNFGENTLYYALDTNAQTEDYVYDEETDRNYMAMAPVALDAVTTETSDNLVYTYDYNENGAANSADARALYLNVLSENVLDTNEAFRYDLDGNDTADMDDVQAYLDALVGKADTDLNDQVLKVEAGEAVEVSVEVQVTETGKAYMDTYFENGIYVEGYTFLTAKNAGGIDLSLPYMGFYGDWTKAPIIDCGYYWEDDEEFDGSQYVNALFSNFGTSYWHPGVNPYIDEEFDVNNISMSPNADGYGDYFEDIYVSLLRNADTLTFTYTDVETGEVYFEEGMEKVGKSYYSSAYGFIIPFVYGMYVNSGELDVYEFTDKDGNYLANNTKLNLAIAATLDYDEHASSNEYDTWNVPITIDTEAPTAQLVGGEVFVEEETGKRYVQLELSDNVKVAAVSFLNKSGTMILAQYAVSEDGIYDVTGFGNEFAMVVGDYAFNESTYEITTEDNDPILDESLLYGYRVYDSNYSNDMLYGWIGIDTETAETSVFDSEYYMDYALTAAEYVAGFILAVDANNALCYIKPGYWDERTQIAELGVKIRELAFDPTTNTLYGYNSSDWALCKIDISTGEVTNISANSGLSTVAAMACDDDGNLYGINTSAELRYIDKETGTWGDVIASMYDTTGFYPYYAQSMTWDSEEDCIFWAAYNYSYMGVAGSLYRIDVKDTDTVEPVEIGTIAGDAEVVGLLKLDAKGFELPTDTEISSIDIKQDSVTMLLGYEDELDMVQTPWYGAEEEFIWTSDNEEVVTVDETSGHLYAVGVGETTVTVQNEDGSLSASCEVYVVNPQAELNGFVMSGNTLYNQWVNFEVDDMDNFEALTEEDFLAFYAGEYFDGYIYAYSEASELYKIDEETKVGKKISDASSDFIMQDMAYNYADGYMYGLMQSMLDGCTYLVTIDLMNGDYDILCLIEDEYYNPACGLAISKEGTIYVVTYTGMLYTVDDVEEGVLTRVGYTGYSGSSYTQSMAFVHNEGEGNDELYWAMITSEGAVSIAYVDTRNGAALPLGTMDGGVQLTAMYNVPENGIIPARETVEVESISLKNGASVFRMLEGSTKAAPISVLPYNAQDRSLNWSVANESIVEVDADNMIVAKQPGTTLVTVEKDGVDPVSFTVEVVEAAGNLYGYILTDLSTYDGMFWGTFKDYDLSAGEALAYDSSYELYSGAYYNGKVYGYGVDEDTYESQFMVFDTTDNAFTLEKAITGEFPDMRGMAFDYSQGAMYGVGGVRNVAGNNSLYAIDLESGMAYELAKLDTEMAALACSTDGILYGVNTNGALYTINKENGELTLIGETGYTANLYQAMTYDHNTGNLYWAQICRDNFTWTVTSGLMLVDTDTADVLNLGTIGTAGCMVTALYTVPEHEIPVGTPGVSKVLASNQSDVLKIGETTQITATPYPVSISTAGVELTYESTNEEVATVDDTGLVTAAGAGTTEIVVKAGTVEARCEIKVVDPEKVMYAVNANGWEVTPVLDADTITGTVTLPDEADFSIATATYNNNDGYFYAVDTDGYLWKFTEDLGKIEQIGTETLVEQLPDTVVTDDHSTPVVADIAGNPYDGKLYAMIETSWGYYYLFEVNVADGTLGLVMEIPEDVGLADEFVFISATELLIYDTLSDYVRTLDLTDGSYGQLAWAQSIMTSGDNIGMAYSEELNLVFIATDDYWYHNGMTLFLLNPETGKIWEYSGAVYDSMVDLIIIENSTPTVTP